MGEIGDMGAGAAHHLFAVADQAVEFGGERLRSRRGNRPTSRRALPSRMRASASRERRSGSSPMRTCTKIAPIRPSPSSTKDQTSMPLKRAISPVQLAPCRRRRGRCRRGVSSGAAVAVMGNSTCARQSAHAGSPGPVPWPQTDGRSALVRCRCAQTSCRTASAKSGRLGRRRPAGHDLPVPARNRCARNADR